MKMKTSKFAFYAATLTAIIMAIAFGSAALSTTTVTAVTPEVIDLTPAKIQALKDDLVTRLEHECESKGTTSDETPNVFDVNGQGSYGLWRWQILSVVSYYKKLYGQDITNKQAILIALDDEKARALTTDVIFKAAGIENWHNCNVKLGLRAQVDAIKFLEK
jgi:hypothetical protein